jgi:hypothetical protein
MASKPPGDILPFRLPGDTHRVVADAFTVDQLNAHFKGLLRKAPYAMDAPNPEGSLKLYLDEAKLHAVEARLAIYRHRGFSTYKAMDLDTIANSFLRDGLRDPNVIALLGYLWKWLNQRGYELRESRIHTGISQSKSTVAMRWTPTKGGCEHIDIRVMFPDPYAVK